MGDKVQLEKKANYKEVVYVYVQGKSQYKNPNGEFELLMSFQFKDYDKVSVKTIIECFVYFINFNISLSYLYIYLYIKV